MNIRNCDSKTFQKIIRVKHWHAVAVSSERYLKNGFLHISPLLKPYKIFVVFINVKGKSRVLKPDDVLRTQG